MFTIILIAVCFSSVQLVEAGDEINKLCVDTKSHEDFDTKWIHDNTPEGGAHIVLGNAVSRKHMSRLLLGRDLIPDEDFSKMCLKAGFHFTHDKLLGDYRGYGGGVADRNCSHTKGADINCKITNQKDPSIDDDMLPYVSYVDPKDLRSFHVAILCFKNGDLGWVSTTIKRNKLTDEEKGRVLKHIESLGLDPKDAVPLYEDACGSY